MKTDKMSAIIAGMVPIIRLEVAKATAPLVNKVAELEAENFALKDAIKQMRQEKALSALSPEDVVARYRALS